MKLFLDTANLALVREWADTGIIDGITTNPTLLSKEQGNFKDLLQELCSLVEGDVSIEVVAKKPEEVYQQARAISKFAPNVVVKIPFAKEYLSVIKTLIKEGIQINVTLIFSLLQSLLVAKLGVKYISPFIGRWDEIDTQGSSLLVEMRKMLDTYSFRSQILAASIRTVYNWHEAVSAGAHVVTIPPHLLNPLMKHPLTERGLQSFEKDWSLVPSQDFFTIKKEELV